MSDQQFRDAIAAVTFDRCGTVDAADWAYHQTDADAVLAMPHVQGWKRATRRLAEAFATDDLPPATVLRRAGMDVATVAWVLDGDA